MKVGITGGMGGGKSTVSLILAAELSAVLLSSDEICKQEMLPGGRGFIQLEEEFGPRFIASDGSLALDILREAVFSERSIKKTLENILHPLVQQEVKRAFVSATKKSRDVVVEVPLLFEVGWESFFDQIVTVRNRSEIAASRIYARDNLDIDMIKIMIASQMPIEQKEVRSDFTVDNSGSLTSTVLQLSWIRRQLAVTC